MYHGQVVSCRLALIRCNGDGLLPRILAKSGYPHSCVLSGGVLPQLLPRILPRHERDGEPGYQATRILAKSGYC